MKKSTKRERLVWLGWLLVGIGAAALVGLVCMPWPMAKAAGLPDGTAVKGVTVVSATVSDDPGDGHGAGQRRGKADPVHYRADGKPRGIMKQ